MENVKDNSRKWSCEICTSGRGRESTPPLPFDASNQGIALAIPHVLRWAVPLGAEGAAPKGDIEERVSASLKRCPDTNQLFLSTLCQPKELAV